MKGPSSRLLRAVIAAALVVNGNAYAAIEGAEDAVDLDGYEVTWTPNRTALDILGGAGGGYHGAASTFDDSAYNYDGDEFPIPDVPTCQELLASAPAGCDVARPPTLTTNGCGGGPTAEIVPDSVVLVDEGAIYIAFPGLYTNACDRHDTCYGIHPAQKSMCDDALVADMVTAARNVISPIVWQRYGSRIMDQINGYGAFFNSSVGTNISMIFFDSAQKDGLCRAYSKAVLPYCKSFQ